MENQLTILENRAVVLTPKMIRGDRSTFPHIVNQKREDVVARLAFFIGNLKAWSGNKDQGDFSADANDLYDLLMDDADEIGTRFISLAEIWRCFRRAALGLTDHDMYGINVISLYRSIADYCTGEGHRADKELEKEYKAAQREKSSPVKVLTDVMAAEMVKIQRK